VKIQKQKINSSIVWSKKCKYGIRKKKNQILDSMRKSIAILLCTLMLHNCWSSKTMKVESAPRVNAESWEVDDASLKKTAISMTMFGALFCLATFIVCVFVPGATEIADEAAGGATGGGGGGLPPGL
jgi:hypothetical protein